MSGLDSNSLHRATLRRSPPESLVTSAELAGHLSASIEISI